jgi:hypothetical protein
MFSPGVHRARRAVFHNRAVARGSKRVHLETTERITRDFVRCKLFCCNIAVARGSERVDLETTQRMTNEYL